MCVAVASSRGPATVPSPKSNWYETTLPSGSDERTPLATTGSGAIPVFGATVSTATGAWFADCAVAVTVAAAEPVAPWLSVTVTRTVQVPAANVCVAVEPDCGPTTVPSPKSKRYEAMLPSASDEAEAFAVTPRGAAPLEGVTVSRATGGWFALDDAWNSSAPRSANVTGPLPRFGVPGSSVRLL